MYLSTNLSFTGAKVGASICCYDKNGVPSRLKTRKICSFLDKTGSISFVWWMPCQSSLVDITTLPGRDLDLLNRASEWLRAIFYLILVKSISRLRMTVCSLSPKEACLGSLAVAGWEIVVLP